MKKQILFLALGLGLTTSLQAQKSLSLQESRALAVEFNKDLKEAALTIQEAEASVRLAKNAYLPMFDASVMAIALPDMSIDLTIPGMGLPVAENLDKAQAGEFTEEVAYFPGMEMRMDGLVMGSAGVTVTQPIYTGGKINAINKQAKIGNDIARENYDLSQSDVIQKTDEAYWNVVTATEAVKLAKSYVDMLTELEEQMQAMYDAGLSPKSEKLKVSVQKNQAELELIRARNGVKLASVYLNQLIGLELSMELDVKEELEQNVSRIDVENGIALGIENRSELKILQGQVGIAKQEEKVIRSAYLPQVGVSASYNYNYTSEMGGDGDPLVDEPSTNIMGSASMPVFHWRERKHKKTIAAVATQKAENRLSKVSDGIVLEITQAQLQTEEYYQAVQLAKKGVEEAQESLEETELSFEVGLNTTSEVLASQAEYQQAQYQLLTSLMAFENIKTKWSKVTGTLKVQ